MTLLQHEPASTRPARPAWLRFTVMTLALGLAVGAAAWAALGALWLVLSHLVPILGFITGGGPFRP
jgi:hypothetical protein